MSTFISKLQFKYYEKGEFTDEKSRDLKETLDLIRNFPWDTQRAKIEYTSPSICIENDRKEYLKIANGYAGQQNIYFFKWPFIYENTDISLDVACNIVTDFFFDRNSLSSFDTKDFGPFIYLHFITKTFNYKTKLLSPILQTCLVVMSAMCFLLVGIRLLVAPPIGFIFIAIGLPCSYLAFLSCKLIIRSMGQSLHLSAGQEVFTFTHKRTKIDFHKSDVDNLVVYHAFRRLQFADIMIIHFKGGDNLKLTGCLISSSRLADKFRRQDISHVHKWKLTFEAFKKF